MARETFYTRSIQALDTPLVIEAAINFDQTLFGSSVQTVVPWTISINTGQKDIGRLVGFDGEGSMILAMHQLKPDPSAKRCLEITVFRVNDDLRSTNLHSAIFSAFERWLLKRGWRGNVVKKLTFTDASQVVPIRRFWLDLGFELVLAEEGKWEEHVVKRWR